MSPLSSIFSSLPILTVKMVKRIYKCLLPALLCIGVESCSSDSLQGTVDAGSLSISVETDSRAVMAGKDGSIVDTGYLPADGTVSLTLFSSVGGSSHTWEDIGDFPQGEYYFAGSYSLEARSGDTMIEGLTHRHSMVRKQYRLLRIRTHRQ